MAAGVSAKETVLLEEQNFHRLLAVGVGRKKKTVLKAMDDLVITEVDVQDVRFPTSLKSDGSDAMVNKPFLSLI